MMTPYQSRYPSPSQAERRHTNSPRAAAIAVRKSAPAAALNRLLLLGLLLSLASWAAVSMAMA